jgi:hypothetical protein
MDLQSLPLRIWTRHTLSTEKRGDSTLGVFLLSFHPSAIFRAVALTQS